MQLRALSEERAGLRRPIKHESLLGLIGHTPLVRLNRVTDDLSDDVEVWAKLEFMNPGGSVKDRPARQIIEDALERGDLRRGGDGPRLLDATSGNTGISYAMLGAALDIPITLVMPENVNPARRMLVEAFGGQVVTSSPTDGRNGAVQLARELADEHPEQFWYANQDDNPSNPKAHQRTTAQEIWTQTDGRITHFVAATGTSGLIMGTNRGLKAHNPDVLTIGCQPADATHELEGVTHMASSIQPEIYDPEELDGFVFCENEDGWAMAQRLAAREGLASGLSSGANVWAALEVAHDLEQGVVVTIICDHVDGYLGE